MDEILGKSLAEVNSGYTVALDEIAAFNTKASLLTEQLVNCVEPFAAPAFVSAITDMKKQYLEVSSLEKLLPKIDYKVFESPILKLSRDANIALSGLISPENVQFLAPTTQLGTTDWLKQINPIGHIGESLKVPLSSFLFKCGEADVLKLSTFAVESNFLKIAKISTLAESSLLNLKTNDFAKYLNVDSKENEFLGSTLLSLSDSYSTLFRTFQSSPVQINKIGPLLLRLTPVEYFNEIDLCQLVSIDNPSIGGIDSARNEISFENQRELQQCLPKINKDFLNLWEGAKKALESENPDRVRHFSVSIRELFTSLLHSMAPDHLVRKWSGDPGYYDHGRPTRRARLMYISRNIDSATFRKFLETDTSSVLEFLDLLQRGTHDLSPNFTAKQLMAIKARAESFLLYMIRIYMS